MAMISPLRRDVINAIKFIAQQMWPGRAGDVNWGRQLRPHHGCRNSILRCLWHRPDNDDIRAQGKDERLPIESLYPGFDFYYLYLKVISTAEKNDVAGSRPAKTNTV
jgi:hypothetical protein